MKKAHTHHGKPPASVFQFKITLNNSSPRIWRRILVPKDYSFFDLHVAIQDAMGWLDSHLHGFYITQKHTSIPIAIQMPDPENDQFFRAGELRDEREEKIDSYFGVMVKQCQYTYDFGDNWEHTILFERELPVDARKKYPQCIEGKNACPPCDCGGVGGYDQLQEVLKNPKHSEHKDMLDWLGLDDPSEFDPTEFDVKKVIFQNPRKRLKEYEKQIQAN